MVELEAIEERSAIHENMIRKVSDNLSISVWAKDIDNKFVYANKTCCDTILKCTESEAISRTDADFDNNALSRPCTYSDNMVKDNRSTMRFIEHALYGDHDIWLDVIKSPWFDGEKIIGTVGVATDITHKIPRNIRIDYIDAMSTEIPIDSEISHTMISKLI